MQDSEREFREGRQDIGVQLPLSQALAQIGNKVVHNRHEGSCTPHEPSDRCLVRRGRYVDHIGKVQADRLLVQVEPSREIATVSLEAEWHDCFTRRQRFEQWRKSEFCTNGNSLKSRYNVLDGHRGRGRILDIRLHGARGSEPELGREPGWVHIPSGRRGIALRNTRHQRTPSTRVGPQELSEYVSEEPVSQLCADNDNMDMQCIEFFNNRPTNLFHVGNASSNSQHCALAEN